MFTVIHITRECILYQAPLSLSLPASHTYMSTDKSDLNHDTVIRVGYPEPWREPGQSDTEAKTEKISSKVENINSS